MDWWAEKASPIGKHSSVVVIIIIIINAGNDKATSDKMPIIRSSSTDDNVVIVVVVVVVAIFVGIVMAMGAWLWLKIIEYDVSYLVSIVLG
jgi:hypothetical protein